MEIGAKPKVSVATVTYNHAPFIRRAIESVLRQRAAFPFELVIGEDGSTDGTREICQEYARRFPHIVRLQLRDRASPERKKFISASGCNYVHTFQECGGEYIAWLDGDDYWTSDDKLARQIKRLEENRDCTLCFHRVSAVDDLTGRTRHEAPPARFRRPRLTMEDLFLRNFIQSCSVVFRRDALPALGPDLPAAEDWAIFLLLLRKGRAAYLDESMAHYRLHGASLWSSQPTAYHDLESVRALVYVTRFLRGKRGRMLRDYVGLYYEGLVRERLDHGDRPMATRVFREGLGWACRSRSVKVRTLLGHALRLYSPRAFGAVKRFWPGTGN